MLLFPNIKYICIYGKKYVVYNTAKYRGVKPPIPILPAINL